MPEAEGECPRRSASARGGARVPEAEGECPRRSASARGGARVSWRGTQSHRRAGACHTRRRAHRSGQICIPRMHGRFGARVSCQASVACMRVIGCGLHDGGARTTGGRCRSGACPTSRPCICGRSRVPGGIARLWHVPRPWWDRVSVSVADPACLAGRVSISGHGVQIDAAKRALHMLRTSACDDRRLPAPHMSMTGRTSTGPRPGQVPASSTAASMLGTSSDARSRRRPRTPPRMARP